MPVSPHWRPRFVAETCRGRLKFKASHVGVRTVVSEEQLIPARFAHLFHASCVYLKIHHVVNIKFLFHAQIDIGASLPIA